MSKTESTSTYDRLDVYEAVKHMYSSPLDFIDDLDTLATDTMTTDKVVAIIKAHKAGQS